MYFWRMLECILLLSKIAQKLDFDTNAFNGANQRKPQCLCGFKRLLCYYNTSLYSSDNASCFHISFSFYDTWWHSRPSLSLRTSAHTGVAISKTKLHTWDCHVAALLAMTVVVGTCPTIILQITLLVSVNGRRLYRSIFFFACVWYNNTKEIIIMFSKFKLSLKSINYKLYASLLLLGFVPTIYTTLRVFYRKTSKRMGLFHRRATFLGESALWNFERSNHSATFLLYWYMYIFWEKKARWISPRFCYV